MKNYANINENLRIKIIRLRELEKNDKISAKKMEDDLILSLSYLIHSVTNRYKNDFYYEDLVQEGTIGLIKAVRHYNCETTFHFVRYAMWWIKTAIKRYMNKNKNRPNILMSHLQKYDNNIENKDVIFEDIIINAELSSQLQSFMNNLSRCQQYILGNLLDINGYNNLTYKEICNTMKVSKKKLKSIQKQLINDIRCRF